MKIQDILWRLPSDAAKKRLSKTAKKSGRVLRVPKKISYLPDNSMIDPPTFRGL